MPPVLSVCPARPVTALPTGPSPPGASPPVSGSLTLGYNSVIKPAYGDLLLQYKSGANAWTTGLTIDNTGLVSVAQALKVAGATNLNGAVTLGDAVADAITVTGEILGSTPLTFEGATNDNIYTIFQITDPSQPRTITFPDASGTVCLSGGYCDGSSNWTVTAGGISPRNIYNNMGVGVNSTSS